MKKKRLIRKAHDMILKVVTYIAISLFIVSACAIDSSSVIPLAVLGISLTWISLFCYANDLFFGGYER